MSFPLKGILRSTLATIAFASVFSLPLAHADEAALTKDDVKKVVGEYLKENPVAVYDALMDYQKIKEEEKKKESLAVLQTKQGELYDLSITPVTGNPEGDITIVEFFDYNCGYCKRAFAQLNDLINEDTNVRVLLKEYPILGESSRTASQAAVAAFLLDKDTYFKAHSALMQKRLRDKDAILTELASIGYDKEALSKKMAGSEVADILRKNNELGRSVGINGTPAFVIGSRLVPGAISLEQMKAIVAEERKNAKK